MLGTKFDSARAETQCRLCLARIRLLKNKRQMQTRQYRKDIADLLRAGKQDYARIRVEAVIREAATQTGYEILELYLELLAVRAPLIANTKEVPRDMTEAISSILYASTRVPDLAELEVLRRMFTTKYGKEFVNEAINDVTCSRWCVNETLRKCLTIEPPEPTAKLQTLSEIAQEYGVEWDMDRARRELLPDGEYALPQVGSAAASGPEPYNPYANVQPAPGLAQPVRPPAPLAPGGIPAAAAAAAGGAGGYADAHSAAAAAAVAAKQAAAAADYAARVAGMQGGSGGAGAGVRVPPPGVYAGDTGDTASPASAGGLAPPPCGWLVGPGVHPPSSSAAAAGAPQHLQPQTPGGQQQQQQQPPMAPPPGWGVAGHEHSSSTGSGGGSTPAAGAGAGLGGFASKSPEEVQAAYDAAVGPPVKGAAASNGAAGVAPASGPAVGSSGASGSAGAGLLPQQGSGDSTDGLPTPPSAGGPSSSDGAPVADEYLELRKRFEALKRA